MVTIDGRERTFSTVSPEGQPRAVVLVLHGSNQTGERFRRFSRGTFDRLTERGAVVVYLDGYRGSWNDARISTNTPARRDGVDDVAFVTAVRHEFGEIPAYLVGFSAGGSMAVRLLHEAPELFAGAGIIAAAQPAPENFLAEVRPGAVPLMMFHGTTDRFVPYEGGIASLRGLFPRGEVRSAEDTARYFAERNGASLDPVVARLSSAVTRTEYLGKAPVVLHTIEGAGHSVPGGRSSWFMGRATDELVAADALAEFWGTSPSRPAAG